VRDFESRFPQWWSDPIQAMWNRSRDAALADWQHRGDHSTHIDAPLIEDALAFGHGARSAYSHHTSWDAVSPQLRLDWTRLGHLGPAAWERVRDVVEHEWRRAGGPAGDAAPAFAPSAER
jgi:hypothetical protein